MASTRSPERISDYLTRDEALTILGVKAQTLYAYVSRGHIRSVTQPDGRSSFYARDDVEKMRAKSAARAGHGAVAASAMRWGEPVIVTSITDIAPNGPHYRGRSALDLARSGASFEAVAEFLWAGDGVESVDALAAWRGDALPAALAELLAQSVRLHHDPHLLQLLALVSTWLGLSEGTRTERIRAGGSPITSARRLIRAMTGTFGVLGPTRQFQMLDEGVPIAGGLAAILQAPAAAGALNRALVLLADHELNPATFAARIAASGGADLHTCVAAALNVHCGTLIGRSCDRVEQLFALPIDPKAILTRAHEQLDAKHGLPGFGHTLYPAGDPRANYLIDLARELPTAGPMLEAVDALCAEFDLHPAIEVGLVSLCRAFNLPPRTAGGVFALARSAGWVAHILEQRLAGFMIRPRARFTTSS